MPSAYISVAGEKAARLLEEDVGQTDGLEVDFRGPKSVFGDP